MTGHTAKGSGPMNDWKLLRQYVEDDSQEAFAALAARYLNLVYSVCRRELDDVEAAEDVTQAVFLILARKAPALGRNVVLSGWLFQTARFAAKNARLQAQRRADYEQKAAEAMGEQATSREDAAWPEIEPLLNRSLVALREGERECVLLRFFQGLSFAEAGAALGLSEEAARKRVARALEKMRAFLGKEGVLIPGVALAALLTAHAAKAAPLTCQASIAHMTASAVAGHIDLSLTGSHVHQLSEGAMRAMKIAQVKAAVGIAATLLVGFSTYAVAKGKTAKTTTTHRAARLTTPLKPGHVLVSAPGRILTAQQIATRSQDAYAALSSYQGTTTVVTMNSAINGAPSEYHTSANVLFARPGRIRAVGTDMGGFPFTYVSNGTATVEQVNATGKTWKTVASAEMALGSVTGIALSAATTVPALLLGTRWGTPLTLGTTPEAEVREDGVDGHSCYVLTSHRMTGKNTMTESVWIDEKTFLLRRLVSDSDNSARAITIGGTQHIIPAIKSHVDERFTDEHVNGAIPESTFTVPAVQ